MDQDFNLKALWHGQESSPPETKEILSKISHFKRREKLKKAILSIMFLIISGGIISVWIYFNPKMITTKIGIIICVMSMLVYVIFNLKQTLQKDNSVKTNLDYLEELNEFKKHQYFMQTTLLSLYFCFLSIGLSLYMIEYSIQLGFIGGTSVYMLTLGWIAFVWFVLRPRKIKKENRKIEELIAKMEELKEQLS